MRPVDVIRRHISAPVQARRTHQNSSEIEAAYRVAVVGGDAPTRSVFRFLLQEEGCQVQEAAALEELSFPTGPFALLVVLAEPSGSSLATVFRHLRRSGYGGPTVVAAHHPTLALRRLGFQLGARDVISLPTDVHGLQTRLRVVLGDHRHEIRLPIVTAPLAAGGIVLHPATRTVCIGTTNRIPVTRREAAILVMLMRMPGQVVGRHALLDHVWGENYIGSGAVLDVYVHRLRRKLARPSVSHGYIHTAPGQGYRFDARRAPRTSPDASTRCISGRPDSAPA